MASPELMRLRAHKHPHPGGQTKPCYYCGHAAEVSVQLKIMEGSQHTHDLTYLTSKQVRACASCASQQLAKFL